MSSNNDTDSFCGSHENEFIVAASGNGSAHCPFPIVDLLDRNKTMRSEMNILEKLINDKYDELMKLEKFDVEDCGEHKLVAALADSYTPVYIRKLKDVIRTIIELEDFTSTDGLNDDVIDEYIRHLECNYEQVLIFGPDSVHLFNEMSKEALKEFLDAKHASDYEKVLFVLKKNGHYSLVLFNSANASFYHYDAANKHHSELAEQIILKLRRHFEAEQLVEVESNSQFGESSLFTVDSMMKIILTAEDDTKESVSPVHVLNLPSQPDYLKIIIMSRYIVTKLSQIEQTIRGSS